MSGKYPERIGEPIPLETMQKIGAQISGVDRPIFLYIGRWGDGKTLEIVVGYHPHNPQGIRIALMPDEARQLVNLLGQGLGRT